jgi:mannose-6-phosphate isomerase-like protein (cupin superfamily)
VRRTNGIATIYINGDRHEISPDTGIYIRPGQNFSIDNSGADSITVISSQCPDPDRSPQFVLALSPAPQSNAEAPVPIVRLGDQRAQPTADRWYRVMVDDAIGSAQVTQFVGSIPPGRAPDHFHNYEEVLFILRGEGLMWAGETNTPIAPGSCIYLPKGQVHCVENTGEGELRLLGVFYPAGSPSVRYEA